MRGDYQNKVNSSVSLATTVQKQLKPYARVSSLGQAVQLAKLKGCDKVFKEKRSGVDAGMIEMPRALSVSWPASCTARSRANLSGDSTMMGLLAASTQSRQISRQATPSSCEIVK
jgi:hypothetical protein